MFPRPTGDSRKRLTAAGLLASMLVVSTLAVGCGGDGGEAAPATTTETKPAVSGPVAEEPIALQGTWHTEPVTLDDMAHALREQGLGEYVEEFRAREVVYFAEPTVLVLTVGDDWDLSRRQGSTQTLHDYDAEYELDADRVTVVHSDGSNTLRWSVQGDTLSLSWLEGTFPPVRGVPDEVIQTALYMTADFKRS